MCIKRQVRKAYGNNYMTLDIDAETTACSTYCKYLWEYTEAPGIVEAKCLAFREVLRVTLTRTDSEKVPREWTVYRCKVCMTDEVTE